MGLMARWPVLPTGRRKALGGIACVLAPLAIHLGLPFAYGSARLGLIAISGLSHAALYVGLALLFGLSLRPGREALVSRLARQVEPCVTPELLRYTRGVTWLWAGFATAQIAASLLLLALGPLRVWSAFVDVLDAPLVAIMFGAEYAFRRWRFRHARLASFKATARALLRAEIGR